MSRGRSRRLWRSPYVFVAAAILFASGLTAGGATLASFNSQTENPATAADGFLGAPSTPRAAVPSGNNALLTWTPATHGLDGQQLWGYDNGTTSTCANPATTLNGAITSSATSLTVASYSAFPASGTFSIEVDDEQMTVTAGAGTATWTVTRGVNGTTAASHASGAPVTLGALLETVGSATANTVTDSSTQLDSPRSTADGHYACYRMVSTRSNATDWTASSSFPASLLGLVPTNVAIAYTTYFNDNNGPATITITYNQNIAYSGPATFYVCLNAGPPFTLTLGSNGSCTAGIGTFSGGSDNSKTYSCKTSTASTSGNQLIVNATGCSSGSGGRGALTGSATYTGTGTTLTSSVGSAGQCTTTPCQLAHTYP